MIALLVLIAVVVAVLEWNRRRYEDLPPHAGRRSGVPDRDLDRLLDDLRATADCPCAKW